MSRTEFEEKFSDTSATINRLVEDIEKGTLALPEMQRPFVWSASDVRDLFDSLFRGYPVGNVMIWRTTDTEGTRQVGVNVKEQSSTQLLIDGQQRVTSLFAMLTGQPVLGEDYKPRRIELSFQPFTARFAVTTAATEKDPLWVTSITELFRSKSQLKAVGRVLDTVRDSGRELSADEEARAEANLERLLYLPKRDLAIVMLTADADVEDVAEVFVRTNSGGRKLTQSDFLLTLMSVHAQHDRRTLEEWVRCVNADQPFKGGSSPANALITPDATQMVRVVAGLAFRRGKLSDVYSLLAATDVDDDARAERFATWSSAQVEALDPHRWHEFLRVLTTAGFLSAKQITSGFAVLATYILWLHGRRRTIDHRLLQNVLARWFFMASLTGRYSGSSETQLDKDMHALVRDGVDMIDAIERRLAATMTEDYLDHVLPDELDTRTWRNKGLLAYEAAQVLLNSPVLFAPNDEKVRDRLAPTSKTIRRIERHHLFPKNYLRQDNPGLSGHQLGSLANRPANASLVDWVENGDISDREPADYFGEMQARLPKEVLERQMVDHALYAGWPSDDYETFLLRRRRLMAGVIKRGYHALTERCPDPSVLTAVATGPSLHDDLAAAEESPELHVSDVTTMHLLDAELITEGDEFVSSSPSYPGRAVVNVDGTITVGDLTYGSLSTAASALRGGQSVNGWTAWAVERDGDLVTLDELRSTLVSEVTRV